MKTTGGFNLATLKTEEEALYLQSFETTEAVEIGEIAKSLGVSRTLPIAIEVRIGD